MPSSQLPDRPDQFRLVSLAADVGRALTTHQSLADMLRGCAEAMVVNLDAAFARIWVLNEGENVLELQASAGQYTHLDGPHGRVPVGQFKIGLIAQERKPHLTNSVVGDPRVSDQEWAKREGMVAFAGYPIVVGERLIGVAALFARHPLPEATLQALASVADQIGVGIERHRLDAERQMYVSLANNSNEFIGMCDLQGISFYGNAAAMRMVGIPTLEQFLHTPVADFFFPEDQKFILGTFFPQVLRDGYGEVEVRFRHFVTGEAIWTLYNVFTLTDVSGKPIGLATVTHDISERKALEAERERFLAQAQTRAEHEALINRIGQTLRSSFDPEVVQEAAVTLLGEALGADRCYFAAYDLGQSAVTIARDYHRPDLPSIQGTYPYTNTVAMFKELYQGTNASVIEDAELAAISAQTLANMRSLRLRSRVSVALVENEGLMSTLTAAMADAPRRWTESETALIEAVATQLRTAVEMARVTQREHRIAEQLQKALQPPTPPSVPGLTLADYYRPALLEAGVGGDFSDVFSNDKGSTFLVVADLSGKGLAAASQVATVRHMLRFALLNGRSVAGPVTALSRTLADHTLIVGFATLFVGRYEAHSREFTYVNCGQDAGLILRAGTGEVEALPPTGPVLGISADTEYEEQSVTLGPGDGLVLYTDGLSEAGPSRAALLTGDGVAALLKQQKGISDPQVIVERLMAAVDAHAGSGVRDDQCLLVAVAQELRQ